MNKEENFDADVGIVGYGPSGVSAANFLGALGVSTLAIERYEDIYSRARAITVNDWTMRIFQSVGLDEALEKGMDITHSLRWIDYDGNELMRMGFPPSDMGHASAYSIYQPEMEKTLREGAERFADHVSVQFGQEVTGITQDAEGVTLELTDCKTGARETKRVRYVLACDGGSSTMREQLGIQLVGDTLETRWIVIDAQVKRWWPDRHVLTFWSDKKRPVVDVALSMGNHRWEIPLGPNDKDSDFATHDQIWRLLETLGVSKDNVEIHQHAFYNHHIRHAERWRDGRVFLLGDAAHMMPPWAGAGMQSGVRDAQNISWKLAGVLGGTLPESVLDTYEAERAPDVERYTQIAIQLGRIIKQELTEEELAAMQPPPDAEPELPPLLQPPALAGGWLSAGTNPAVGALLPQPRAAGSDGKLGLLDDVLGSGFLVLGADLDPASVLSPEEKRGWEALGARFIALRSADQHSQSETDVIDIDGTLIAWLHARGADVVALRPDRFIAAASGNLAVPG
ncbi:MAG: monooxygenase [Confluentimicrobium sp.]|jgi:3-(3-hydroxy-phenyl)propionate hydroxylase|uniref:bifunctional 3-(3-hydroxy-phenyl)propionate/3-hydroxycinnamic acid hydroxylase n=1 Tax=Actibacterium sp. TaxID=1872125 RepID=UPI000C47C23D|nr:bifunctional 3-(3-hydroxy-phenyl)propionate/3-hydroxycinnamic acid hydroxylase [Actibacterium sp.]MBC56635.1 monooxygenase [Actibacterium sp.]MDY6860431.1 bifunctional 3-(3-hydroxy-phenyl)propionate/3-hydroxycinnamic acid hydroxylase [Pseudomonadota bacterium]|tara:strand:+ start:8267 stop:9799 length:1533 start_codon:yes stop_codon:yes gene_type:complete